MSKRLDRWGERLKRQRPRGLSTTEEEQRPKVEQVIDEVVCQAGTGVMIHAE